MKIYAIRVWGENMNVLLNGATGGTNFGDFLFAQMYQDYVETIVGKDNIYWYDGLFSMSDFYKKHLGYNRSYKLRNIDVLVCISGGYFCGNDHNLRDYIIRYLSYFHIALCCIFHKKPVAIVAVEVGKSKSRFIDTIQKYILKKAELVIVRNQESFEQLKHYGIKNAICTADSVHAINKNLFATKGIPEEILNENSRKMFFHVQLSQIDASYKVLPAVNTFLESHPEYCVIIGTDQYVPDQKERLQEIAKRIKCDKIFINQYDDPAALCKVLDNVDFIVTPKLHVGIVGATLGKSVISFSIHKEKIVRFYNQLNENGRSLSMSEFDEEKAKDMLEAYHNKPIHLAPEIISKAQDNFKMLGDFLLRASGQCGEKHEI